MKQGQTSKLPGRILGILGLAVLLSGSPVHAQFIFTGADSSTTDNWSDDGNWTLNTPPPNDGTGTVTLSQGAGNSNVDTNESIGDLVNGVGTSGTLTASPSATLTFDGNITNLSTSDFNITAPLSTGGNYFINQGTVRISSTASGLFNTVGEGGTTLYDDGLITGLFGSAQFNTGLLDPGNANLPAATGAVGATLAGTGTLQVNTSGNASVALATPDFNPSHLAVGATISPGDPTINHGIGTLTLITQQLIYGGGGGASSDFTFGAGTAHSQVNVASNGVSGAGALILSDFNYFNINSVAGTTTTPGEYDLITYTGAAVSSATLGTEMLNLPAGWTGSLFSTDGVVGLDLTSTGGTEAVPEPQTWAMIGGGLLVLFSITRRKAVAARRV